MWRNAWSCEPSSTRPERASLNEAVYRATDMLQRICNDTNATEYRVFISGGGNFRKVLYPDYKANRDAKRRPEYVDPLRDLLLREWNAEVCSGYEADDGIGMARTEGTIIVSNDKDFLQLEGDHFNPVKGLHQTIDSRTAALNFYAQMLEGDSADNVTGIDRIGKVRARRLLEGLNAEEMHQKVYDIYGDPKRFFLNFRLLRILRSVEEWNELKAELGLNETTISEGQRP